MNDNHPRVGVGVFVLKEGKVLVGQRLNSHGDGTWSLAGGHLEFGETPEECALREVKEETGLDVINPRFLAITNDVFQAEDKHYVTLFMCTEWIKGEPQVLEPDLMVKWDWFEWGKLPTPLFLPVVNLIKSGISPL